MLQMGPTGQTPIDPLAEALMRKALAPQRIDHPMQGVGQLAQVWAARKRMDDAKAERQAQTDADAAELGRLLSGGGLMPERGPSSIPGQLPTGMQPFAPIPQPGGEASTIPFNPGTPTGPVPMPDPLSTPATPPMGPVGAGGAQPSRMQLIGAMLQSGNPRVKAQGINLAIGRILNPAAQPQGFTLSPGQTRYGPQGRVIAAAAPKSDAMSEEALAQRLRIAQAGKSSTNVNVNNVRPNARPLTAPEAAAFGLKPEEATNYIIDGKGDLKARPTAKDTQTDSDIDRFNKRALTSVSNLRAAIGRFQKDKSRSNYAAMRQALSAVAPALAQARNVRGEPGDALINQIKDDTPGLLTDIAARGLGMDSALESALSQIETELGGGKAKPAPAPGYSVGEVRGGYRYTGGDPTDQKNWEVVK